jgi:hypothetical protein
MCRDPFLSCLEAFGYCVVRLPRADLEPLQLLLRAGDDLERLGHLSSVLVPGPHVGLPRVSRNRPAASISGRRTGSLDVGVGLSLLGGVVAAMGGSQIGLDDTYRAAHTITFEFRDVMEDSVELVDLDQYLADARVNRQSAHVETLLDADRLYVTTAVVKSRSLTVEARDEDGTAVSVHVPALQQLAGGQVSVSLAGDNSSAIVYAGTTPLGFGFRAVRLFYEDGRYGAFEPLEAGEAGLKAALELRLTSDDPAQHLLAQSGGGTAAAQSGCHDRGRPLDCQGSGGHVDTRGDGALES